MASNFVAGNATFGVRETASILEKITWGLAVVILVLSVCTSFMIRENKSEAKAQAEEAKARAEQQMAADVELPVQGETTIAEPAADNQGE